MAGMAATTVNTTRRTVLAAGLALVAAAPHAKAGDGAVVWEHKQISAGSNRPDFAIETPLNTELLVSLHERRPLEVTEARTSALALLKAKGFVREGARGPRPSVLVAGLEDGRRWFGVDGWLERATADLITASAPRVRTAVAAIDSLSRLPFQHISFLILSNVLLDSWQINAVEQRFVRAERPLRGGGRYYYALLARARDGQTESFGIYGNQFFNYGDVAVGLYGNRRLSGRGLPHLDQDDLSTRFGIEANDAQGGRAELVRRLASASRGQRPLTSAERGGLEELGLVSADGTVAVPVMREADYVALNSVAGIILDDLTALLERARPALRTRYERSPYAEEASFEEYLIWWYHFFYTAVTDRLAARGALRIPAGGVTTYIVTE